MSKRDVLDEKLAQKFAWRAAQPAGVPEPDEPPPAPSPDEAKAEDPEAEREAYEQRSRACAELAKLSARAWETAPLEAQVEATIALMRRAQKLSFDIVVMQEHPLESVRLWRLIVRHYARLPRGERRGGAHALSFMHVSPLLRESADLLVEVAETGDSWLALMMDTGVDGEAIARRHPEIGARFARILDDDAASWAARELAVYGLALAEFRDAIPSLRRALRLPHARIRWIALSILLQLPPPALTEDDVLWLLQDAVAHPLPRAISSRSFETSDGYADAIVDAVAKMPPPGGFRPLELIADGGGAHIRRDRSGLDDRWAMRALAAGYPARAVARIDRGLTDHGVWARRAAVEAAAVLPEELARPRLLEAAGDPGYYAAERARELWFKRFESACPVDALAGVNVDLLKANPGDPVSPSERFFSRLLVLRGSSDEARAAMLEVLLAEAPSGEGEPPADLTPEQRETLALALFCVSDTRTAPRGPSLPASDDAWTELFMRRFGDAAFEGILALARREGCAGVDHGWLGGLASFGRTRPLTAAQKDRLRDVAVEALTSPAWDGTTAPLRALSSVGAPAGLIDRLWSITMDSPEDDPRPRVTYLYAQHLASTVLAAMKDVPHLDERIAVEGAEARRTRSLKRFGRMMRLGCQRKLEAAYALSMAFLEKDVDEDMDAYEAASTCAYALDEAGRISVEWLLAALERPEEPVFAVVADVVRRHRSPAVFEALERVLESPVRRGASAATAAASLVAMDVMLPDDPRIPGIVERAPLEPRSGLVGMVVCVGGSFGSLRGHVVELLSCADSDAARTVFEDLYGKQPEGTLEVCEEALARGAHPSIRGGLERLLDKPNEAALYWRDPGDEEDQVETTEDEEEDDDEDGPC